jgi:hypothetical protein
LIHFFLSSSPFFDKSLKLFDELLGNYSSKFFQLNLETTTPLFIKNSLSHFPANLKASLNTPKLPLSPSLPNQVLSSSPLPLVQRSESNNSILQVRNFPNFSNFTPNISLSSNISTYYSSRSFPSTVSKLINLSFLSESEFLNDNKNPFNNSNNHPFICSLVLPDYDKYVFYDVEDDKDNSNDGVLVDSPFIKKIMKTRIHLENALWKKLTNLFS